MVNYNTCTVEGSNTKSRPLLNGSLVIVYANFERFMIFFDCELHEQLRNMLDLNRIKVIMIHMFNRNMDVVNLI
jgi:hypothetical protein